MVELYELQQMQGLDLALKVRKSALRIQEWYEHFDGEVYVSYSGGVDSQALGHQVRAIYPDVPFVFVDTGLEYPEIKEFVKRSENVETLRPTMPFHEVVKRYGYPVVSKTVCETVHKLRHNNLSDRYRHYKMYGDERGNAGTLPAKWHILLDAPFEVSSECCGIMKKKPFKAYERRTGRAPYIGMLAEESRTRTKLYLETGCNSFGGKLRKSMPLGFWRRTDVLEYLYINDLPICSVYGDIVRGPGGKFVTTGVEHTGCMFCGFGVHREATPNRFQKMAKTHPKHYEFCMNKLGLAPVLDYLHVPYVPQPSIEDYI